SSTSVGKAHHANAVFLQAGGRVPAAVTITCGLRLDGYDAFRSEWQLSPRLNAVWRPTPTTAVHAGYARYFTPPRQEFVSPATLAKFADTTAAPEVPQDSAPRAE